MSADLATTGPQTPSVQVDGRTGELRWAVFALFFFFGGITSLNDILIPKLKHLFQLSYFEAMLVQFVFFISYFLVSLPAASLVRRVGYLQAAAIGLVLMAAGCLLFVPASSWGTYMGFLLALFVLAAGITTVQVVANPLVSMLGPARTVHSRLTFAQAFNSVGTTIFPLLGAALILGPFSGIDPDQLSGAARQAAIVRESSVVGSTYVGLAGLLAVVALLLWLVRDRLRVETRAEAETGYGFDLFRRPRFAAGTLGIFMYVGAEVAIGSILVNFLMQPDTLALGAQRAGEMVALYWGGAMVGRLLGAYVLRIAQPARVLLCHVAGAVGLVAVAGLASGAVAGVALIAVGLCNSIMFPTIFSLASEELGERAAQGSGIICMAIVGGAIVPAALGLLADAQGLRASLAVPIGCYLLIGAFAMLCLRRAVASDVRA